jgi:hypothetical protein
MLRWLKGKFLQKGGAPVAEKSLVQVVAGHTFRVLDPMTMPKVRQAALFVGEYEREWGMSKTDLLAYDDILIKETAFPTVWANKDELIAELTDKVKRLYNLIDTRRVLIQEDFQYKPFLKAACHIILCEGEDAAKVEREFYDRKLELCEHSEDIMLFFLNVIMLFQKNIVISLDTLATSKFLPPMHILPTEKRVLREINTTPYLHGT